MTTEKKTGLALLREPFPAHATSKLPKPTKAQTDKLRQDFKQGIRCKLCGGWHHKDVVHLDYVGHAALTDRLLDCDIEWNWEPVQTDDKGMPVLDPTGGMWIKLTVCGVTRLGYGDADGKTGGNAVKERIGDALRNAAMRFGAALDLWHKGDLHADDEAPVVDDAKRGSQHDGDEVAGLVNASNAAISQMEKAESLADLAKVFGALHKNVKSVQSVIDKKDELKAEFEAKKSANDEAGDGPLADDYIPEFGPDGKAIK